MDWLADGAANDGIMLLGATVRKDGWCWLIGMCYAMASPAHTRVLFALGIMLLVCCGGRGRGYVWRERGAFSGESEVG